MRQTSTATRTAKTIAWPTSPLFTIRDVHRLNPSFLEITLRVRFAKEIENGKVAEIGSLNGGRGRPVKVFTLAPVTEEKVLQAVGQEVSLAEAFFPMTHTLTVQE